MLTYGYVVPAFALGLAPAARSKGIATRENSTVSNNDSNWDLSGSHRFEPDEQCRAVHESGRARFNAALLRHYGADSTRPGRTILPKRVFQGRVDVHGRPGNARGASHDTELI